jgi:microcystin-dependent protein
MTGQINAAAGLVTAPGYTFTGSTKTGFYLAGTNQIGWASNGVQGATFNADTSVTFAGTINAAKGTIPIGGVMDFAGSTAPAGWLLCFGQQVSTTTYAALFAVLSTTYGSGAGTFGIPDYRGRSTFGQDNMGGSAANRITAAVGNFDGTVLGNSGGLQVNSLSTNNLPPYTPAGTNSTSSVTVTNTTAQVFNSTSSAQAVTLIGSGPNTPSFTVSAQNFSGSPQGGTSVPFTNLPPCIIANKIIYCGI